MAEVTVESDDYKAVISVKGRTDGRPDQTLAVPLELKACEGGESRELVHFLQLAQRRSRWSCECTGVAISVVTEKGVVFKIETSSPHRAGEIEFNPAELEEAIKQLGGEEPESTFRIYPDD